MLQNQRHRLLDEIGFVKVFKKLCCSKLDFWILIFLEAVLDVSRVYKVQKMWQSGSEVHKNITSQCVMTWN